MLHGFLNIDKSSGMTSHDVVGRVRRLAGQKRVGHGGTLDPAATGVLPVALGDATRLLEFLVEGRKRYRALIKLGVVTTTDDAEGAVVAEQPVPEIAEAELLATLATFVGVIQQIPPMYSAIQVGGRRLYDLAREGTTIELAPRTVEIDQLTLLGWESPLLSLDVTCGKGTYIRAIARDLGAALGCGAHLQALRRTAVGPLTSETGVSLDALAADPALLVERLLPPESAVAHLPRVDLDLDAARLVRNGMPLALAEPLVGDTSRAHADGALLALLRYDGAVWRPFKVFSWR